MRWTMVGLVAVAVACSPPVVTVDGGSDEPLDGGDSDAGVLADAGAGDAGNEPSDAGLVDAGTDGGFDGGPDAGSTDAGLDAGGGSDAGFDGGSDAGARDAGSPDAGRDGGSTDGGADAGRLDGGTLLRVIAANLTSGNNQSYDLGHGQRILQALQGDIIAMQELNVGSRTPAELRAFVDATFGAQFSYVRGSGNIPNGVVSRFPILDAGEWDDTRTTDREFTWALVDVPGPDDLLVVSVHLLSNTSMNRNAQGTQLLQYIAANAPTVPHVVIAGDFNTDVRGEMVLSTFAAKTVTAGPWPVDGLGNGATNITRSRPYDWVLASPALHANEVPVSLGSQSFPTGLVFDTRVFSPLPPPALSSDSAAANMQHMAVVRDFALP